MITDNPPMHPSAFADPRAGAPLLTGADLWREDYGHKPAIEFVDEEAAQKPLSNIVPSHVSRY